MNTPLPGGWYGTGKTMCCICFKGRQKYRLYRDAEGFHDVCLGVCAQQAGLTDLTHVQQVVMAFIFDRENDLTEQEENVIEKGVCERPNDDANWYFPECPQCGAPPGQAHDPTCPGNGKVWPFDVEVQER